MPGLTGNLLDSELTEILDLGVTLEDLPFGGIYPSTQGPEIGPVVRIARVLSRMQSRFSEEIRFRQQLLHQRQ